MRSLKLRLAQDERTSPGLVVNCGRIDTLKRSGTILRRIARTRARTSGGGQRDQSHYDSARDEWQENFKDGCDVVTFPESPSLKL